MPSRPADEYRELLLGCGRTRDRRFNSPTGAAVGEPSWHNLTTLDYDTDVIEYAVPEETFVEWDLICSAPLPFPDNHFDELHAYHVLEHIGQQGDFRIFFDQFSDYWRIMKPGGWFFIIVPQGRVWTWGDPGHTRQINEGSIVFLSQVEYIKQCDIVATKTAMTDYRRWYKADFDIAYINGVDDEHEMRILLQAIKPSRCAR